MTAQAEFWLEERQRERWVLKNLVNGRIKWPREVPQSPSIRAMPNIIKTQWTWISHRGSAKYLKPWYVQESFYFLSQVKSTLTYTTFQIKDRFSQGKMPSEQELDAMWIIRLLVLRIVVEIHGEISKIHRKNWSPPLPSGWKTDLILDSISLIDRYDILTDRYFIAARIHYGRRIGEENTPLQARLLTRLVHTLANLRHSYNPMQPFNDLLMRGLLLRDDCEKAIREVMLNHQEQIWDCRNDLVWFGGLGNAGENGWMQDANLQPGNRESS